MTGAATVGGLAAAAADNGQWRPEPVNVLVVDDRPENLLALEAVLEPLGQNVIRAGSGEEALRLLLTRDFAVILLDVQMPGMDGFTTAKLIKERDRTRAVPIIFLTAISKEDQHVFEGYESGAVDYLTKPFEPTILRSKVAVFVELHQNRRALQESEERFRRSFDDAAIGMALVGIDGRWLRVNGALCELTGYSARELLSTTVQEITPYARELEADLERMEEVLSGRLRSYRMEKRYMRADGHVVWVQVSLSLVRDADGEPLHFISQVEDITARKRAEEDPDDASLRDPLTGLANRALLMDRLELALARQRRRPSRVAVLFIDLDRFKVVNDSLGHGYGDLLLIEAAGRLRGAVRASDTVARLGGDTFVILSEELDDEQSAVGTAERLGEVVREPFEVGGNEAFVTASIGIALTSEPRADPEALVAGAEAAMYRAKDRGKARYEFFDEAMRARARERLSTENALHRAVERGEIRLLYQPVVQLDSGAVTGVEALVRWEHEERGTVAPEDFVPLAEETGLILPIGRWVLEEACRQAARWSVSGTPLEMSVNLSACQLAQADLPDLVATALADGETPPGRLCLEITESVLMHDAASMARVLGRLKELGVRLAVDDFGTGYSSLSYLHRFPVDVLKIDRSFVVGLGRDRHSAPIVSAVVGLGRALDLASVAEGVETVEQLAALRELGCDAAQGFLIAPPQTPEELGTWVAASIGPVLDGGSSNGSDRAGRSPR